MWGHMGDHMNGWGTGWGMGTAMVVWSLLAIALLVFVIVATVRLLTPRNGQFRSTEPDELEKAQGILAERYARGELDEEEFRRRRDAIEALRNFK